MKEYRVVFQPRAQRDLVDLYNYIEEQSGPRRAGDFVGHIRDYCLGFTAFPERGAVKHDLGPNVRVVGFRRRISIVFSVEDNAVWILGIFYGGRKVQLSPWDEEDSPP